MRCACRRVERDDRGSSTGSRSREAGADVLEEKRRVLLRRRDSSRSKSRKPGASGSGSRARRGNSVGRRSSSRARAASDSPPSTAEDSGPTFASGGGTSSASAFPSLPRSLHRTDPSRSLRRTLPLVLAPRAHRRGIDRGSTLCACRRRSPTRERGGEAHGQTAARDRATLDPPARARPRTTRAHPRRARARGIGSRAVVPGRQSSGVRPLRPRTNIRRAPDSRSVATLMAVSSIRATIGHVRSGGTAINQTQKRFQAEVGDVVAVHGHHLGESERLGEILDHRNPRSCPLPRPLGGRARRASSTPAMTRTSASGAERKG